jgi:hypothetical protein
VRIGVNTGTTVVGRTAADSRGSTLAFGDTPNIAARIQTLGAPDTVTISDRTDRVLEGSFAVEPLGKHALKGITNPVELYRVLARRGIGKSRLARAAAAATAVQELGMQCLVCECSPFHQGDPLHPIVEGLRRHWRVEFEGATERLDALARGARSRALLASALGVAGYGGTRLATPRESTRGPTMSSRPGGHGRS